MASDALRGLACRYRELSAGTPGTRDQGATGSEVSTPERPQFQGDLRHGTPRTPETRKNINIRTAATDPCGLTVTDRVLSATRFRGIASPRTLEPNLDRPDPQAQPLTELEGSELGARHRPPSWADITTLPPRGCVCTCCSGHQWWREREAGKGWRCSVCHPPSHLSASAVDAVTT
jgi:hypothetical protein